MKDIDSSRTSLRSDDFIIKIADFGFARELQEGCAAKTVCDTPITMAPDIFGKDPKYDKKADLWSLGAITYEMIVGRPPFYSMNYKKLFQEVMKGVYFFPKEIGRMMSIEGIGFIDRLLRSDPKERMTWEIIKEHPFIVKDITELNKINMLCNVKKDRDQDGKKDYIEGLELNVNVKSSDNNYLWLTYKDKNQYGIELDKINKKIAIVNDYIPIDHTIIINKSENQSKIEVHFKELWEIIDYDYNNNTYAHSTINKLKDYVIIN